MRGEGTQRPAGGAGGSPGRGSGPSRPPSPGPGPRHSPPRSGAGKLPRVPNVPHPNGDRSARLARALRGGPAGPWGPSRWGGVATPSPGKAPTAPPRRSRWLPPPAGGWPQPGLPVSLGPPASRVPAERGFAKPFRELTRFVIATGAGGRKNFHTNMGFYKRTPSNFPQRNASASISRGASPSSCGGGAGGAGRGCSGMPWESRLIALAAIGWGTSNARRRGAESISPLGRGASPRAGNNFE